uniref:Uncharacterized protein n=1 Tax=Romanomermis culicivorax TaxID=13658 RepID=A0A915K3H7_ROMCU
MQRCLHNNYSDDSRWFSVNERKKNDYVMNVPTRQDKGYDGKFLYLLNDEIGYKTITHMENFRNQRERNFPKFLLISSCKKE